MINKGALCLAFALLTGCTGHGQNLAANRAQASNAEQDIALLVPGKTLRSEVEKRLGPPTKIEKGEKEGLFVATYYLDLSTNYPGVFATGKCLMTIHYSGQWAGLTFTGIKGPHYPDN